MSVNIGIKPIVKDGLVLHLDPASPKNYTLSEVEVLVVGGGGGGSFNIYDDGAGGGGGGVLYSSFYRVTPGSAITVTVGNGGAAGNSVGNKGQNSIFGNLIAQGGGGGQGHRSFTHAGANGGSGGGSGGQYSNDSNAPGEGTVGQGHRGGHSTSYGGGGGGGAGSPGIGCPSWQVGGIGGDGLPFDISGKLRYYGGGGGGYPKTNFNGLGGKGGGGDTYVVGTPNTGGGGGGGKAGSASLPEGKAGGSGIVIVRYPGPQKATGGNTIENVNGYTIHTFTTSGTFTPLNIPANAGSVYGLQDLSGNSNHGTVVGGVTYDTDASGSFSLNGTNAYISCGRNGVATPTLTTETWIKKKGDNGHFLTIDNFDQPELRLTFTSTGLLIQYYDNGAYFTNTTYTTSINLSSWYHIASTIQNGLQIYYINGSQILTTTGVYDGSPSGNVGEHTLGTYNRPGAGYNGYANVKYGVHRIYNRFLSSSEIQQNFNATRGRFGI